MENLLAKATREGKAQVEAPDRPTGRVLSTVVALAPVTVHL